MRNPFRRRKPPDFDRWEKHWGGMSTAMRDGGMREGAPSSATHAVVLAALLDREWAVGWNAYMIFPDTAATLASRVYAWLPAEVARELNGEEAVAGWMACWLQLAEEAPTHPRRPLDVQTAVSAALAAAVEDEDWAATWAGKLGEASDQSVNDRMARGLLDVLPSPSPEALANARAHQERYRQTQP